MVNAYYSEQVHKDNIHGLLITDYAGDDLDKNLKELFGFIIKNLNMIYNSEKNILKVTSYSNFFKSDANYEIILKYFDELDEYDKEKVCKYMIVFDKTHKKT